MQHCIPVGSADSQGSRSLVGKRYHIQNRVNNIGGDIEGCPKEMYFDH